MALDDVPVFCATCGRKHNEECEDDFVLVDLHDGELDGHVDWT